ncbi:MAG: hypothetical protein GC138_03405 [Gammaproteobacteria bacterium]|nr:hypothetical protein [Gammaproteobacteria bacterium]
MSGSRARQSGLTLIGLLIALSVLSILIGLAMPAWQRQLARHRLTAGLTALHGALIQARHEAIFANRPLVFVFCRDAGEKGWCFVVTDDSACDCRSGDCPVSAGVPRPVQGADFPGLDLSVLPRNGMIRFYPARGTTSAGSIVLSVGDAEAKVIVSSLGRVRICSASLTGVPPCV